MSRIFNIKLVEGRHEVHEKFGEMHVDRFGRPQYEVYWEEFCNDFPFLEDAKDWVRQEVIKK